MKGEGVRGMRDGTEEEGRKREKKGRGTTHPAPFQKFPGGGTREEVSSGYKMY